MNTPYRAMIRLAGEMPAGTPNRRVLLAHIARTRIALRIREMQHMTSVGHTFGVMSAYGPYSKSVNQQRHGDFVRELQIRGYTKFHSLKGSWEGVSEKSILIPNVRFKDLVELGRKYEQDSIIYNDRTGVIGMYFLKENKVTFAVDDAGSMAVKTSVGDSLYSKSRGISFEFGFLWGRKQPWNGTTPYTLKDVTWSI